MAQRPILTGIRHGYTGYTMKGCGCDICRSAYREYKQDYRQRQREKRANPEQQDVKTVTQPEDPGPPPRPGTWIDDVDDPCYEEDEVPDEVANQPQREEQKPVNNPYKGPVLLGVEKDLTERNVYESAPGLAALATRLAQIVDNQLALPQAPAAAGRLLDVYQKIGVNVRPRGSKLAAVRELMSAHSDDQQEVS